MHSMASRRNSFHVEHRNSGVDRCSLFEDGYGDSGSSIASSQELISHGAEISALGCLPYAVKRNLKALRGRLDRWTHVPSALIGRYLHRQMADIEAPFHFHRSKSRSRRSHLSNPAGFKDHESCISLSTATQEDVKDIHLDPLFMDEQAKAQRHLITSDTCDDDESTKPVNDYSHCYHQSDHHVKGHQYNPSSFKLRGSPLASKASPYPTEDLESHACMDAVTKHEDSEQKIGTSSGIHWNIRFEKDQGLQSMAIRSPSNIQNGKPVYPESLQAHYRSMHLDHFGPHFVKWNMHDARRNAMDHLPSEKQMVYGNTQNDNNCISSLASHISSFRNYQSSKQSFGDMFDCILQERLTPMRHPDIKYRGAQSKIDVTDIKNAISALISTRRFEDLADVEDFLQCYTRLNCPYFTNMVNEFFCDIYNDILQCEACFDERFPLIQRFV